MRHSKESRRAGATVFELPRVAEGGTGPSDCWLRRLLRADADAARLIDEHVRVLTKHKVGQGPG